MTFTVRDLMIDVLPTTFADADKLLLCDGNVTLPPKPVPPPPPPPQPPKPGYEAATGGEQAAELAPLSVLREKLHQALHP
ncbi:MAG TPA: hypothetical protein VHB47_23395 [Thermoanaerobaculia bacterium]|nr:hypothetical protein [Thermoanaerobaculia bacterium]